ncbi:MAG: hypothetical protein KIT14_19990 [bacterium]|nr:hypothetical protein [bacterium]
MPDLVAFAALDWEARAMCDALGGVEPARAALAWQGHLGDATTCLVLQIGIGPARAAAAAAAAPAAQALVSVGCAGALVAPLAAGDALAAGEVLAVDAAGAVAARLPADAAGPSPGRRRAA